jgi:Flp pilus assembly protein CpaB
MMKRAQSLTITTVVIAILAVLVMAVLFFVFTGRMGLFTQETKTCPSGPCVAEADCTAAGGTVLPGEYLDPTTKRACAPGTVCCSITV